MIKTIEQLLEEYKNYDDVYGKIRRLVEKKELIPIIRGIYETNKNTPGYYLSSFIYGPSYLSFDYALSYYNLIPEKVYTYTSATFNKRKKKIYQTSFGVYSYQDIPKDAFPFDIQFIEEDEYVYQIASPEKAICDKLYSLQPVSSQKELMELIFVNLRIDQKEFYQLNIDKMIILSSKYNSNNLYFLSQILKKEKKNANY